MRYAFLFGDYETADVGARDTVAIMVQNLETHVPEGDENGCRIEIQVVHETAQSPSAAKETIIREPVWRADMFSARTNPGSWDRMHFHPTFDVQEPCARNYADAAARADPVAWAVEQLSDIYALFRQGGYPQLAATIHDEEVRAAMPHIAAAIADTLYERGKAPA